MAPRPRFLNDIYNDYPDNTSTKVVELQAADRSYPGYGDRYVLLQWSNGKDAEGDEVTQIIQLSGMAGNYAYYYPLAKKQVAGSRIENTIFPLGNFTCAERERILALADSTTFEKTSVVNSCRTWTRDLLMAMVNENLLSMTTFNEIDEQVPLLKRQPEA
ncbi:hypothetical protein BDP27DRAFT_1309719 [Rhodocollybia butyracea]|uniref:Uncharacterized protein n=1 Tax=Rhodocollybia butyracea TaxID=206335 RepID=A0A9P5UGJ6_9AGAR|nr:hypothetical protein BDP27DRAFT_1309719 [Rhodocollybia butyracea]